MYRIFYPVFWGALLAFPLHQCTMPSARTHAYHLSNETNIKPYHFSQFMYVHKKFAFFISVSFSIRIFMYTYIKLCVSFELYRVECASYKHITECHFVSCSVLSPCSLLTHTRIHYTYTSHTERHIVSSDDSLYTVNQLYIAVSIGIFVRIM